MDQTKAEKAIQMAVGAGILSALVTAGVAIYATSRGTEVLGFSAWSFLDVALIAGLSFGIWRKSRACAVAMLVYFVASKLVLWSEAGKPTGVFTAIAFGYFYVQGVRGTLAWHAGGPAPAGTAHAPVGTPRFGTREEYERWKAARFAGGPPPGAP